MASDSKRLGEGKTWDIDEFVRGRRARDFFRRIHETVGSNSGDALYIALEQLLESEENLMRDIIIPIETIESKILTIRNQKVMLDRDLAELYV